MSDVVDVWWMSSMVDFLILLMSGVADVVQSPEMTS